LIALILGGALGDALFHLDTALPARDLIGFFKNQGAIMTLGNTSRVAAAQITFIGFAGSILGITGTYVRL